MPGGQASYPSSVLMNAVPARVAGVGRLVVCVPTPRGEVNPLVLLACELAGVDARYLGESDPARVRTILAIIFRLAERGRIRPVIDQRFALSDAPAALRALASGTRIGKIIVTP